MSENQPPKPAKPAKKPTAADKLRQELEETRAQLQQLQQQLTRERRERDATEQELADANEALKSRLQRARTALKPLHDRTRSWNWPPLAVAVWGSLTWGELKEAADSYPALSDAPVDTAGAGRA